MNIIALLPDCARLRWRPVNPSAAYPFRWQSEAFPTLRIESPHPSPWGRTWSLEFNKTQGIPNYGQGAKAPLSLNLRLTFTRDAARSEVNFVFTAGGFLDLPPNERTQRLYVFDNPELSWLIIKVNRIESPIQPAPLEPLRLPSSKPAAGQPVRLSLKPAAASEQPRPSGDGPLNTNINRTNSEREEASFEFVRLAVETLAQQTDWPNLGARARIDQIIAESHRVRGYGISRQTLYKAGIYELWQ